MILLNYLSRFPPEGLIFPKDGLKVSDLST